MRPDTTREGRTIGVVTVARSDYGIYRPILRRLAQAPDLSLRLFVGGAHLSAEFGATETEIVADGFAVDARIDGLSTDDSPGAACDAISRGVAGFGAAFGALRPDLVLVLGDRYEMLAAALAAQPYRLPLAHIHGGEVTEGAMDDAFRHAITKMSHLHFVSTEDHARRVRQMGEEPWRVTVSGAPSLDTLAAFAPLDDAALSARIGLPLDPPPLLVTLHPETLGVADPAAQAARLLEALHRIGWPVVFTQSNADPGGRAIGQAIDGYVAAHANARRVDHLGTVAYFSLMARALAMVGNSSSGLVEAPSFGLPVVNIGGRQAGRTRGVNVIDVDDAVEAIMAGLREAATPAFRARCRAGANPYGNGRAADIIVERLRSVPIDPRLTRKAFVDIVEHREGGRPS